MAAGSIEKVTVVLQALTSGFARELGQAQTQLKSVGKNMQEFGAVMDANNFKDEDLKKTGIKKFMEKKREQIKATEENGKSDTEA